MRQEVGNTVISESRPSKTCSHLEMRKKERLDNASFLGQLESHIGLVSALCSYNSVRSAYKGPVL